MKPTGNFKIYNEVNDLWRRRDEYEVFIKRGILSDPTFNNVVKTHNVIDFMYGWVKNGKDMQVLSRVLFVVGAPIYNIHEGDELTLEEVRALEKCGLNFRQNDEEYERINKMGILTEIGT